MLDMLCGIGGTTVCTSVYSFLFFLQKFSRIHKTLLDYKHLIYFLIIFENDLISCDYHQRRFNST
jgi:hypothetical protein